MKGNLTEVSSAGSAVAKLDSNFARTLGGLG